MNDASKNEDWENCTSIFPNERDEKIIELRNELEDDTIVIRARQAFNGRLLRL